MSQSASPDPIEPDEPDEPSCDHESGGAPQLPPASWGELLSGSNLFRSIVLAGGVGLHAVNVYVVTTILPSIVREIGGLEYYAWSTTLFVIASIVGAVLSTKLIAQLRPRGAYFVALLVFCFGSALCGSAHSMPWLLVGRTVQGVGGGLLLSICYALIRFVFEPRLWSRAMGLVSGMWGIATLCGPAVGGVFAQAGNWRWAFWSLFPVAGVISLIVWWQLAPSRAEAAEDEADAEQMTRGVPLAQVGLLVAAVLVISVASLSQHLIWNGLGVIAGVGLMGVVIGIDRNATSRLLPTGAYSFSHSLGRVYAVMMLLVVGITTETFVPNFLQTIHHTSPLEAGYLTAAMAAGWTAASLTNSGRIGDAARRVMRRGPIVNMLALLALAVLLPRTATLAGEGALLVGKTLFLVVALGGVGFGIGMAWPHLLLRVLGSALPGEETLASASITIVQLCSIAIASALAGLVANMAGMAEAGNLAGVQRAAFWLFALFAIGPASAAVLMRRVK